MLCLSSSDLKDVLDLDQGIEIIEDLYRQYAEGAAVRMPVQVLESPGRELRISGGSISGSDGLGVRLNLTGNRRAVAVLFNLEEADLIATMIYPYSTLRTASLVGVVARQLARSDSSVMAMIGTGRNALGYCDAIRRVRPIEVVRVFSRDPEHRTEFARKVEEATRLTVEVMEDLERTTSGADITCVATSSAQPVLEAKHVDPGTLVVSMGRARELDASVYLAADNVVVSYKPDIMGGEKHLDEDGQIPELVRAGAIDWVNGVHTLGGVLVAPEPIRPQHDQVTVFKDFQTGFGDIALALAAYRECVTRGLGISVDL